MKTFLRKLARKLGFRRSRHDALLKNAALTLAQLYRDQLLNQDRYREQKRLNRFGQKIFSQGEEDGMIAEIFRRIGTTNRIFVEIGVENGLENNTLKLLFEGWRGLWLEGSPKHVESIRENFKEPLAKDLLRIVNAFITRENADSLLAQNSHAADIDLFVIDIEGNDYHILEALQSLRPRVIVIEYNAKFPPPIDWIMPYNLSHRWQGNDHFGASLKAYERLMKKRGYSLVGCSITGTNSFFVRDDALNERFLAPFTAENHYEPARYWLLSGYHSGHPITSICLPGDSQHFVY